MWGWLGVYSAVSAVYAIFLPRIAKAIGNKATHAVSLIAGGVGLISIYFISDPQLLIFSMVGVGMAWASILAMPYAILAGSIPMSKMGVYGLIRVIIPMFPNALSEYGHLLIVLSIVGIIYGSLLAWVQTDFKRLIAYSSFAHIGLIAAGVFSNTQQGMDGAMVQMIAHGINAVGLFIIVDYVERTAGTRSISALGGIRTIAPAFATLFLLILLGSVGLPLTNGFVGEFLLLSGVFKFKASAALFAGLTMILGAVYMLHVYQKTMLGEEGTASKGFADIKGLDFYLLGVLAVLVFISGIFPNFLTLS